MTSTASGAGVTLIIIALLPVFAAMITTGDFGLLTGNTLWITLGVAFAVGVAAGITVLSSGLSGESIAMAFVLAFGTSLYIAFVSVTITDLANIPYGGGAIISGLSVLCYVLGLFFLLRA
jgi:hypothetical protein